MTDIVLATINARYSHASLGLRYLRANLGELRGSSSIVELTAQERPVDIAERLLALSPTIVGFGVYVWNACATYDVVDILKRLRPELVIVLGGPEVSYDPLSVPLVALADYVVTGEADVVFAELAARILNGSCPRQKVWVASPVDLAEIQLPYSEYTETDLAQRNVYVEASRGCVFGCEFCLSSIQRQVRRVPATRFFAAMQELWQRGLRRYRFVDRTFNLSARVGDELLAFFVGKNDTDLFLHAEVVPDRMPPCLISTMARFSPASLQLEIGIQTVDDTVAARIGRHQCADEALGVVELLRTQTSAHLHADLIVGLPGEDLQGFARGFDRLYACRPHEIQVGILKKLRGAAISRHDALWQMVYAAAPPYELLQNRCLDFATMQELKRFARYWEVVANSGRFPSVVPLLCVQPSPFFSFLAFSRWLFARTGATHALALDRLARTLSVYLVEAKGMTKADAEALVDADYTREGRRSLSTARVSREGVSHGEAQGVRRPRTRQERHHVHGVK